MQFVVMASVLILTSDLTLLLTGAGVEFLWSLLFGWLSANLLVAIVGLMALACTDDLWRKAFHSYGREPSSQSSKREGV